MTSQSQQADCATIPHSVSRRLALGQLAAAATTTTALSAFEVAAQTNLDPHDPSDFELIARKIRFRIDNGLVFNWLHATKYGQLEEDLVPLFSMEAGSIARIKTVSDGIEVTTLERTFYVDHETGELLHEWINPYTGETLSVRRNPVGPSTVKYLNDGSRVIPAELGGARLEATTSTYLAVLAGDAIWIRNDGNAKVYRDGEPDNPFQVTEWSTMRASLSDVSVPDQTAVEADISLHEVTNWSAWMNMGDRPGVITTWGAGRKVLRYEDMPEKWRTLLAEANPDIAADPLGALDRPPARFEQ